MMSNTMSYDFDSLEIVKKKPSKTIQLLIFRILFLLGGHKYLADKNFINEESIVSSLGMNKWVSGELQYDHEIFLKELRERYIQLEKKIDCKVPKKLNANIKNLSKVINLNKNEQKILIFIIMLKNNRILANTLDLFGSMGFSEVIRITSIVLNINEDCVYSALKEKGRLSKSGLVKRSNITGLTFHFDGHVDLITDEFSKRMMGTVKNITELFKEVFSLSGKPLLNIDNYNHMNSDVELLLSYLSKKKQNKNGKNVLIYGPPGIGKTQLARVIAKKLGISLFEISTENSEGEGLSGIQRLRSLRISQSVLNNQQAIMMFDECDDVFGHGYSLYNNNESAEYRKGWINKSLEDNHLPCLWLTNSIGHIDSAYVRRFDVVIEMKMPGVSKRKDIIKSICHDLISETLISQLAESESLSPAVVQNAVDVVLSLDDKTTKVGRDSVIVKLINNTMKAQGHHVLISDNTRPVLDNYSSELSNSNYNLNELKEGILRHGSARLCLYGPPGTGKTIFAHWLGQQLGQKVISKKGSDLIGPYVGQTELNIAAAFEEANTEKALLLFDEVDSFLQDRSGAKNSWEITSVNEILTQMENFNGVFVASTNLIDHLDSASMRRFDMKIEFDYLTSKQVSQLFKLLIKTMKLKKTSCEKVTNRLSQLNYLTPGDFHMLERQAKFQPFSSTYKVVDALIDINKSKGEQHQPIGFVY